MHVRVCAHLLCLYLTFLLVSTEREILSFSVDACCSFLLYSSAYAPGRQTAELSPAFFSSAITDSHIILSVYWPHTVSMHSVSDYKFSVYMDVTVKMSLLYPVLLHQGLWPVHIQGPCSHTCPKRHGVLTSN